MHEFSLCKNIVDILLRELDRLPQKVKSVRKVCLVVGNYHQIVPENLEFAFEILVRDTVAAGARLEMSFTPIIVECGSCGRRGEVHPPVYVCQGCEGGGLTVVGGKELMLRNVEVDTDE